jgi:hypothetical protein
MALTNHVGKAERAVLACGYDEIVHADCKLNPNHALEDLFRLKIPLKSDKN